MLLGRVCFGQKHSGRVCFGGNIHSKFVLVGNIRARKFWASFPKAGLFRAKTSGPMGKGQMFLEANLCSRQDIFWFKKGIF